MWTMWQDLFYEDGPRDVHWSTFANASEPFFDYVRWSFLNCVIGELIKLTDPPKSCGKENLTLDAVIAEVLAIATVGRQYESLIYRDKDDFVRLVSTPAFKDARNRVMYHNDLQESLAPTGILNQIEIETVRYAVNHLENLREKLESSVRGSFNKYPSHRNQRWHDAAKRLISVLTARQSGSLPSGDCR